MALNKCLKKIYTFEFKKKNGTREIGGEAQRPPPQSKLKTAWCTVYFGLVQGWLMMMQAVYINPETNGETDS